ncbi:hypothetical protein CMO88_00390 [Candidatus Woesearchaeota archaeon]|nr:hypothetical protein [Candidatus Woesearchaeota archaeon]
MSLLAVSAAAEVKGTQINVKLINQNPDPVEPGDDVELRFRLDNNISRSIDALEVELLPKYPFSLSEPAVKDIGSLDAKQKGVDAVVVKYKVLVDKDADEGEHQLFFRYRIGSKDWIKAGPFDISVESSEAILGVLSAKIPESINAGSVADFDVVLKNFGKSLIKDVRLTLDLDKVPLSPIGTSNEKVIKRIAPGESTTTKFKLIANADASSAYYKTQIRMDYLDDSGNKHLRNSTIGLLVYDEPEFSLDLKETEVNTPSANGEVVLSVSNIGPAEIRFMEAELLEAENYKVVSAPNVYLGNLEPDDFETAEFDIRTANIKPRDINLKVRLTYKDSLNKEIVKNSVVKLPLYSTSDAKKFGLLDGSKSLAYVLITIAVYIILVVFIAFMLIDCWKNSLPKYKKVLWTLMIITGIGAVLYYFIARRRK